MGSWRTCLMNAPKKFACETFSLFLLIIITCQLMSHWGTKNCLNDSRPNLINFAFSSNLSNHGFQAMWTKVSAAAVAIQSAEEDERPGEGNHRQYVNTLIMTATNRSRILKAILGSKDYGYYLAPNVEAELGKSDSFTESLSIKKREEERGGWD